MKEYSDKSKFSAVLKIHVELLSPKTTILLTCAIYIQDLNLSI